MDVIKKLSKADYISFTGLLFAWISNILITANLAKIAILMSLTAFALDVLDGAVARKFKQDSLLGRHIDSYADIFTYVIFSSIVFIKFLSPHPVIGIITGYLIVLFGGLRLIRFNNEGILKSKNLAYYRGVTVVHIYLLVLALYFIQKIGNQSLSWIYATLIIPVCPLMLSNFKSYKFKNPAYLILIILSFFILALFI